jgi:1-acylglycerone phosphate reductase
MASEHQPSKKTVLITGCSTGSIGEGLAKEFHRRGYHVIATARSLTRLQNLVPLGIQIEELDVTSTPSIQALRSKTSSLDILINNAGGLIMGFLSDTSMEDWRRMFDQNLFSLVETTQAFLPLLIESKGIIVNQSSQASYFAIPGNGAYATSKKAVCHYTDVLRNELVPFDVRVVELMTGIVASNIILDQMPNRPYKVPANSLYAPIKEEFDVGASGKGLERAMHPDEYAKKVASELLDGGGWRGLGGWLGYERPWIWQGWLGRTTWWCWWMSCFWKGLWDPVLRRMMRLYLIKGRVEEERRRQ